MNKLPNLRGASTPLKTSTRQIAPGKWHAVAVVCQPTACAQTKRLQKLRFLSKDAPRLPLAECTMIDGCRCSYKHYQDRRGPPRRREELSGMRHQYKSTERRNQSDRRVAE